MMFRHILIRAVRWGGVAFAGLTVGYVLSIGPGTVFLFYAGPDRGWFRLDDGYDVWQTLYEQPIERLPMPVRPALARAASRYMSACDALYHTIPARVRHPGRVR